MQHRFKRNVTKVDVNLRWHTYNGVRKRIAICKEKKTHDYGAGFRMCVRNVHNVVVTNLYCKNKGRNFDTNAAAL